MNLMQVKINANATSDTNDYANGSNLTQPSVTAVGTMNSNKGIRRWFSSLLLLGIVFSALAFSAEAKAAPGDVTVMHIFMGPDGRMRAWIVVEGPQGGYFPFTVTQNGGIKDGWNGLMGKISGGDGENPIEFPVGTPLEGLPDLTANAAKVQVTQPDGPPVVIVKTDKPVQVQLVNSQEGTLIGELETVTEMATIDISKLTVGCKYMLVIKQDIDGYPLVLPAVNVCRMP